MHSVTVVTIGRDLGRGAAPVRRVGDGLVGLNGGGGGWWTNRIVGVACDI